MKREGRFKGWAGAVPPGYKDLWQSNKRTAVVWSLIAIVYYSLHIHHMSVRDS